MPSETQGASFIDKTRQNQLSILTLQPITLTELKIILKIEFSRFAYNLRIGSCIHSVVGREGAANGRITQDSQRI